MNFTRHSLFMVAVAIGFGFIGFGSIAQTAAQNPLQEPLPDLGQADPTPQISEPLPIIDRELTGWVEAGSGDAGQDVGTNIRANWVMIDQTDAISGSVISSGSDVADMKVFLLRDGFVASEATTDVTGRFVLHGLTEGAYTIVGYRPDAMFMYGFIAVANRPEAQNMPRQITTKAVAGMPNNRLVARLIEEHSPDVKFRVYGEYDFGEDEANASHFGWEGLANFDVAADPANTISAVPVEMNANRGFTGRLHQISNLSGRPVEITDADVMLIQEGQIVAETKTDSRGTFAFRGLNGGHFGLVAMGAEGLGAIGIELVSSVGDKTSDNNAKVHNVSFSTRVAGSSVSMMLTSPESTGWINDFFQEQAFANAMAQPRPPGAPAPGPPSNFGGFGGGPGGFGIGGEWIWAGAVAGLIGAASSDNGLNPVVLPPLPPQSPSNN